MKWYQELLLGVGVGLLILAVLYRVFATEPNVRVIEYRCIEETCKVEYDDLRVQFHELDSDDTLLMLRQNHYRLTGKYVVFRRAR
jgi:hypothetical protein